MFSQSQLRGFLDEKGEIVLGRYVVERSGTGGNIDADGTPHVVELSFAVVFIHAPVSSDLDDIEPVAVVVVECGDRFDECVERVAVHVERCEIGRRQNLGVVYARLCGRRHDRQFAGHDGFFLVDIVPRTVGRCRQGKRSEKSLFAVVER